MNPIRRFWLFLIVDGRVPAVVVVHGADSTKEETYFICRQFWIRGMATIVMDGPGQAEARIRGYVMDKQKYLKALSTLIDKLCENERIDSNRIAVWGQCLGGHLAMSAAAEDNVMILIPPV